MTKRRYLFLSAILFLSANRVIAQDGFSKDFEPVRNELVSWDPVRGEWLSSSMAAIAANQPIPDRNFPEDFTPAEMYRVVPEAKRNQIRTIVQTQPSSRDSTSNNSWKRINSFVERSDCKLVMARTYGDPHLSSFDGATYAFQTVGEFILVKSASTNMEIQVRQRAQTDDFSLNTAIAMNVAGDRLGFYANEKPDGNTTTPIRLNGEAIYIVEQTYYLDHGGTIRKIDRNNYEVTWPTGETVSIDIRQSGAMSFMNISTQIYPCADRYEGVLGNANGRSDDDFDTRGRSSRPANLTFHNFGGASSTQQKEMEQEYLAFLAKDFAASWRITQSNSLFDYGYGENTLTYTDERFPKVHHTLNDLSQTDRDRARRDCERQGITGNELNACIYDRGFLNIAPAPRPIIQDRAQGHVVKPVVNRVPNVNPGERTKAVEPLKSVGTTPLSTTITNPAGNTAVPNTTEPTAPGKLAPAKTYGNQTIVDPPAEPVKPAKKTIIYKQVDPELPLPVEKKATQPHIYTPPIEVDKPVSKPVFSQPVDVFKTSPKVVTPPVEEHKVTPHEIIPIKNPAQSQPTIVKPAPLPAGKLPGGMIRPF